MKKCKLLVLSAGMLSANSLLAQEQSVLSGDGVNMALMLFGAVSLIACRKWMKHKAN